MYVGKHQIAQRVIDHAMTLQWRGPFECIGNDGAGEMPATIARAFVPDVFVRFIDNIKLLGRECSFEPLAYQCDALAGHGSTLRNGFTRTSE